MAHGFQQQLLLQLRGAELEQAMPDLEQGRYGLEISEFVSPQLLSGEWRRRIAELQSYRDRLLGPVTIHGPFLDLSPASPEPRLRELTKERYRQALEIAQRLRGHFLVLHTQFNPNIPEPHYPKLWLDQTLHFFNDLLPEIEAAGVTILLENMWDPCPDYMAELLQSLPPEQFAACLDAGHAHLNSRVSWRSWVEVLGKRLRYVHLSDNHGGWDEHLALGRGNVDFPGLFQTLKQFACQPWFVLEMARWADVESSLHYLDQLADQSETQSGRLAWSRHRQ